MNESTKDLIACAVLIVISAALGGYFTSLYYDAKIAEMERARAEAVAQAEKKNANNLSDATNTILLAQAEYDSIRGERDRLLARLRHANSSGATGGATTEALRTRVAKLEELVGRMAETASRCGDAFERCAEKHDALAEAVK